MVLLLIESQEANKALQKEQFNLEKKLNESHRDIKLLKKTIAENLNKTSCTINEDLLNNKETYVSTLEEMSFQVSCF